MDTVRITQTPFETLTFIALAVVYTPIRVLLAELGLAPREVPEWLMRRVLLDFDEGIAKLLQIEVRATEPGWAFLVIQGDPIAIRIQFSLFEDPRLDFRDYMYAKTRFEPAPQSVQKILVKPGLRLGGGIDDTVITLPNEKDLTPEEQQAVEEFLVEAAQGGEGGA
ncbi:MAG: hypothetical protein QMD96_06235 [Anaerosomatales bacterium]|nr:hypothetical protein [Anaerosomatales bacterium]